MQATSPHDGQGCRFRPLANILAPLDSPAGIMLRFRVTPLMTLSGLASKWSGFEEKAYWLDLKKILQLPLTEVHTKEETPTTDCPPRPAGGVSADGGLRYVVSGRLSRRGTGQNLLRRKANTPDEDRGLLKRNVITRGYCVRATNPREQLVEVLRRFDLLRAMTPFRRCVHCNAVLRPCPKGLISDQLLPETKEHFGDFSVCPACRHIYWKG